MKRKGEVVGRGIQDSKEERGRRDEEEKGRGGD